MWLRWAESGDKFELSFKRSPEEMERVLQVLADNGLLAEAPRAKAPKARPREAVASRRSSVRSSAPVRIAW
jgi:hypothetical protein